MSVEVPFSEPSGWRGRAFADTAEFRIDIAEVIPLEPLNAPRPPYEVGSLVWWEGRVYAVDGLSLLGHTWIAELNRPEDFLAAQRVSWCVPANELIAHDLL